MRLKTTKRYRNLLWGKNQKNILINQLLSERQQNNAMFAGFSNLFNDHLKRRNSQTHLLLWKRIFQLGNQNLIENKWAV